MSAKMDGSVDASGPSGRVVIFVSASVMSVLATMFTGPVAGMQGLKNGAGCLHSLFARITRIAVWILGSLFFTDLVRVDANVR